MISALKQENSKTRENKEIEFANSMLKKELNDVQEKSKENIIKLENQIKELEISKLTLENALKQINSKNSLSEREWKVKYEEISTKNKELEWKIKQFEEENKKHYENENNEIQIKLSNKNAELEKVKSENLNEISQLKEGYEKTLEEIRKLHKQEKESMEIRLEKMKHEFKEIKHKKEAYLEEIHELNSQLDFFKQQAEVDMENQRTQRDLINAKEQKLNNKLSKAKLVMEAAEELKTQFRKTKKQNAELKINIAKLEASEKILKESLAQKEAELENAKNCLINEKKKMQDEFDIERLQIVKELTNKNLQIDDLSRQLRKSSIWSQKASVDVQQNCNTVRPYTGDTNDISTVIKEVSKQHMFFRIKKDETLNAPRQLLKNDEDLYNKVEYKQLKEYFLIRKFNIFLDAKKWWMGQAVWNAEIVKKS